MRKLAHLFRRNAIILIFYVASFDMWDFSTLGRWSTKARMATRKSGKTTDGGKENKRQQWRRRHLYSHRGTGDEPCFFFEVVQLVQVSLLGYRPCSVFIFFFVRVARSSCSNCHARDGESTQNTLTRRTACAHFSRACTHFHQCTCIGSRSLSVSQKSSHLWFHVSLWCSWLRLLVFLLIPPISSPITTTVPTGIRTNPSVTSLRGRVWPNGWLDLKHIHYTSDNGQDCHVGTQLSIVDWVYFRTQILLATSRTQHQPREGEEGNFFGFSEVERSSPWVGGARSKRHCPTVLQNLKLFRWILVWEWTDCRSWLMGCGDRSVTFIEDRITNPRSSRKLLATSPIQTQTEGKSRCWRIF